jgi:hypothetical protein
MQATIAPLLRSYRTLPPGIFRDTMEMAQAIIAAQTFGGRLDDTEHMLAVACAPSIRSDAQSQADDKRKRPAKLAPSLKPKCRSLKPWRAPAAWCGSASRPLHHRGAPRRRNEFGTALEAAQPAPGTWENR